MDDDARDDRGRSDDSAEGDESITLLPQRTDIGTRLDRFVADNLPHLSRATVQNLIESGNILVDGVERKAKFKMTPGEVVTVTLPEPEPDEIQPDDIPLDIVYEDRDVIVIDKPAGMVVHPAPGHPRGTLANALVAHVPDLAVGGSQRPGIVHRLDKDTSGLIVAAKSDRGRTSLISQWNSDSVEKRYLALVDGVVEVDEATVDAPIGRDEKNRQRMAVSRNGRDAISHFRVLERFPDATLLEVSLETGRTHQIRVHMAFIGHSIVGDPVYGRADRQQTGLQRQFLHASELSFALPDGKRVSFASPLPADLERVLVSLGARSNPNL
ncbi:MAG: RluA family pseudouridine synthase [Thermomicrobiales bacterium]